MKRLGLTWAALGLVAVTLPVLAETDLQKSLRETETAFAKSVADGDADVFASFIAEDAVFLGGPGQALKGKAAIVTAWAAFFTEGGPTLKWEPTDSQVRPDGSFGMTRGPYWLTSKNAEGETSTVSGTFMSVWLRQDDGSWKVVFDGGSAPCPK